MLNKWEADELFMKYPVPCNFTFKFYFKKIIDFPFKIKVHRVDACRNKTVI